MQFSGRHHRRRSELVVATGGGSRVVCGVPITACLCGGGQRGIGGGQRGVGDASICSSFPSRQATRSSWPLEFGSEVGDSSILIDCLGRKPRKFVAPRLGLLPQWHCCHYGLCAVVHGRHECYRGGGAVDWESLDGQQKKNFSSPELKCQIFEVGSSLRLR